NLTVADGVAYVARTGTRGGLTWFDVSELPLIDEFFSFSPPECEQVHDVEVADGLLMLSCLDQGFQLFQVNGKTQPKWLAEFPGKQAHSAFRIESGTWVVTSEHFAAPTQVVSWERPSSRLVEVGRFATGGAAAPHEVACLDQQCWLAYHQEG